ncbi:MAG: APC family permease [Dactylosporangium sp.]|nr:APC family permease [Dactylosporangium sp.]NNJ61921.1 APC family permease [Dactylosporangium sp.]
MATSAPAPPVFSPVTDTLAANRLGVPQVVFFVMSAATPLTVIAGVVTTAYGATGLLGLPAAFVAVGLLLALFSVSYVAMARKVGNCGAFYSYLARGLGRPAGVAGAWVALIAYNSLQIGLYGAIGAAASPLLEQWFGLTPPWWAIALLAWALTAMLGLLRVDVNGRLLAVLLLAEVAVIVVFSTADLLHPAGGTVSFTALSPGNLFGPGVGALLVLAVLGSVGFESAVVFSEESKNPQRTVPMATYLSVGLIAALYTVASWAMTVAVGPSRIVEVAREQGTEVIFTLAGTHLGATAATIGHTLFTTSIVAAMIAFHNTTSRYMYALGREGVLFRHWGRTSAATGSPHVASLTQSTLGLAVILAYALAGWDPLITLFYRGGTSGGLGVLLLIAATSIAVVVYFARNPSTETLWRRRIAPVTAMLALGVVVILALDNVDVLLGVQADHALVWAVPTAFAVAAGLGFGWGLILRTLQPQVYARIGLGAKAALASMPAAAVPNPRHGTTTGGDAATPAEELWR